MIKSQVESQVITAAKVVGTLLTVIAVLLGVRWLVVNVPASLSPSTYELAELKGKVSKLEAEAVKSRSVVSRDEIETLKMERSKDKKYQFERIAKLEDQIQSLRRVVLVMDKDAEARAKKIFAKLQAELRTETRLQFQSYARNAATHEVAREAKAAVMPMMAEHVAKLRDVMEQTENLRQDLEALKMVSLPREQDN